MSRMRSPATSRSNCAKESSTLSDAAVAVIVSTGGVIDYCFMSDAMKALPKLDWIRKGTPLPTATATATLAADPERIGAGERLSDETDVRDWLGGTTRAAITEESIGLGRYGKVLTVLSSNSIGQEDESEDGEDDEDSLVESWTPRFRR